MAMIDESDSTRLSWDAATGNHNAHKGDQAAFLRGGGDTLFEEELSLLGDLSGRRLVHLQCNSGQDTLCLARRGARATGVDFSTVAIEFARELSAGSGIAADFVQAELLAWMHETPERFEVAFSSYGAVSWMPDLDRWAHGVARVLEPGGRFVYVEFHPQTWCIARDLTLTGDDYFQRGPLVTPVHDYVAASGAGLQGDVTPGPIGENTVPAWSWQYGLGETVTALATAGLVLETLREYPHANGFRASDALVLGDDRRWRFPEGAARLPLMFGIAFRRPAD
jgi:SAM-dependent methyltransferase